MNGKEMVQRIKARKGEWKEKMKKVSEKNRRGRKKMKVV